MFGSCYRKYNFDVLYKLILFFEYSSVLCVFMFFTTKKKILGIKHILHIFIVFENIKQKIVFKNMNQIGSWLPVFFFFFFKLQKTQKKMLNLKNKKILLRTPKKCSLCFQKLFSVLKKQREQRKHEEYVWFPVSFCSERHKKHRKIIFK